MKAFTHESLLKMRDCVAKENILTTSSSLSSLFVNPFISVVISIRVTFNNLDTVRPEYSVMESLKNV